MMNENSRNKISLIGEKITNEPETKVYIIYNEKHEGNDGIEVLAKNESEIIKILIPWTTIEPYIINEKTFRYPIPIEEEK